MTEDSTDSFLKELKERGLNPSPETLAAFDLKRVQSYYNFLQETNERGGFFSKNDSQRILERHLFESLIIIDYVTRALSVSRETTVADVGTGPGLPGYLFACLKNPPRITLIDSSRRRLSLLEQFHQEQEVAPKVRFLYARAEEIMERFDLILVRALIPFPFLAEVVTNLQKKGGTLAYATGELHVEEREEKFLKRCGYVSRETLFPEEIQFLGKRSIILLLKERDAEKGYPRSWKTIKEEISQWEK